MGISAFDHPWVGGLFADQPMMDIWSAQRTLGYMQAFESSWSRALGKAGLVDAAVAEKTADAIEVASIDVALLKIGMATDGVPIPSFVSQLRAITDDVSVHAGATSQDVMDTALVLVLRDTSNLIANRLTALIDALYRIEKQFGDASLMGRTRMQAATVINVRDRLQTWRLPLQAHGARLEMCRSTVERVQIGGASGDRAALGDKASIVVSHVAQSLNLSPCDKAWHAMRESIVDYASFLSLVTGSLGKLGQDVALMSQQGIDDIAVKGGGGSSAMAHKQNPVLAELLVTLARFNAVQVSGMHQSLVHEQERSGAAWSLEWMLLPPMAQTTGRALSAALLLVNNIESMGGKYPGRRTEKTTDNG